jgi:hypothetical protein
MPHRDANLYGPVAKTSPSCICGMSGSPRSVTRCFRVPPKTSHPASDAVHRSFPTAVAQPHYAESLCMDCLRQQTAQPGISRFSAEPRPTCAVGTKPTSTCLPDRRLRQSCSTTTKPVSAITHLPLLRFPAIAKAGSVGALGQNHLANSPSGRVFRKIMAGEALSVSEPYSDEFFMPSPKICVTLRQVFFVPPG